MNIKATSGYIAVLTLSFLLYAIKPVNPIYYSSLPVLMVMFPIIAGYRVKLRFAVKDIVLGITVSAIILLPYYIVFSPSLHPLEGGVWERGNLLYYVLFQLLSVAFPEEFFFRGFLQDSTGRNLKSVLAISLLFAAAHLPRAVFLGEWISLLSFFPSLVMGWLYMKTNNIIPGTIFHLLANLVYKIT
jgi:membrane protease YdiL (CAAX protease family)